MDIPAARKMIQIEETAPQAAVSESVQTRSGAAINFINTKQNKQFYFGCGGPFGKVLTVPFTDIGIQEVFKDDSTVDNLAVRYGKAGTSGTSEFDIKWRANGSGVWASIFSTTPKVVGGTAPDSGLFDSGGISTTPAGCTAPVLSKTDFAAGDVLRCDVLSKAVDAEDLVLVVTFRPR